MERSAIILAGGFSSRLGRDKGLVQLSNKPLVKHVTDKTKDLVDERLVVVSSSVQAERYSNILGEDANVLIDDAGGQGPLAGAATGFERAKGKYSLLLPCDTPFVSRDILHLLLELCINRNAAVPRWPNRYIEPLQAAYCTRPALEAARNALLSGKLNLQTMVDKLQKVRYVSTLVLEQLDPRLRTFLNVNTVLDLKKAEVMLKGS
ncbi:MAG TPA: molybdenum cofactor guanylyltransferase [Candidatus Acidoferrales bacterium]|nr:molybdenum cofactor guanylyltransferase [Candidatus Acidoferrales bacterium]